MTEEQQDDKEAIGAFLAEKFGSEQEPEEKEEEAAAPATIEKDAEESEDGNFLVFKGDDGEVKIPKKFRTKLTTKAGDSLEPSVEELARAIWSQRENAKLVNENQRMKLSIEEKKRFDDLLEILDDKELKGSVWTANVMRTMYEKHPDRREDIRAYINDVARNSLPENEIDKSFLGRKDKKAQSQIRTQEEFNKLGQLSVNIENSLKQTLGIESDDFAKLARDMSDKGEISVQSMLSSEQGLRQECDKIYNKVFIERAQYVKDKLGLSDQEAQEHIEDFFALLQSNIKNPDLVAKKLAAIIGKPSNTAAREKVQKYKEKKQSGYIPKPVKREESKVMLPRETPTEYLERIFGKPNF